MNIDNDELLRFADMPDGFNADQMDGFRQAAILANKRFDRTVAERVLAAEDDALNYARKMVGLLPDQPKYLEKAFTGDFYRKNHKGVKVSLRAAVQTQGGEKDE